MCNICVNGYISSEKNVFCWFYLPEIDWLLCFEEKKFTHLILCIFYIQNTKRFRFQQAKIRASTSSIRKASMLEIRTQRRGGNVEIKKTYFYNILFYYWNQQSVDGCWFMYVFFAYIFGIFLINNTIFSVFTNQKKKTKTFFLRNSSWMLNFFIPLICAHAKKIVMRSYFLSIL